MSRNITERSKQADEMIKALAEQASAVGNPPEGGTVAAETPEVTEPVIAAQPDLTTGAPDVGVVQADELNNGVATQIAALRKEVDDANQRWKVLQGMINKKDAEIEQMRVLLTQIDTKPTQPTAPAAPTSSAVTDEDVDTFGAEWIDVSRRIAQEVVSREVTRMEAELAQIKKALTGVDERASKTAAEMFDDALTNVVPNWRELNVDAGFLGWLDGVDEFSGATRLDLLQNAYAAGDVTRTAKFFSSFNDKAKIAAPAADAPQPVADPLIKLVSPGRARGGSTQPEVQTARMWTRAAIQKLYNDKRTGAITEDEFVAAERDLFKAQRENRLAA